MPHYNSPQFAAGWFIWLVIFSILAFFSAIALAILKLLLPPIDRTQEREESLQVARDLAAHPQRVMKIEVTRTVILHLRALSDEMEESRLVFFSKHPDFEDLRKLERHSVVSFLFQEEVLPRVEKQDATAYLRLRR